MVTLCVRASISITMGKTELSEGEKISDDEGLSKPYRAAGTM